MSIIGSIGSTLGSWFGTVPAKLSGGSQNRASPEASASGATWANRAATPEQAMQLAAFWACLKLISQTVGTLPLRLYTLRPDRSRIEAFEDPLYGLLQYQPNADHTGVEFWEGVAFCLALWGNAFALKTTRNDGSIIAIELLRPFWMTLLRDAAGEPIYRYRDPLFTEIDYRAEDLLHVRGFGACEIAGLSPIMYARQTIGSAIAADETAGRLFSNGMKVGGWFKYKPGNLTADQRQQTREALVEPYTGTENAFKVGILPGDFDWVGTTLNAKDAELIAVRRMNVEEICRWFGVPPILIGHAADGQTMWGTGQESIVRSFLTMGLRPLVHRIEACISRDIIGRAQRLTMKAEFDISELIRGDTRVQGDIDAQDVNNGLRTRNEVRASRNLPPLPGGDTLTVQSALIPVEMLGTIAKLPADKPLAPGADVRQPFGAKFAPDQPRDAHGRFTTGGGETANPLHEPLSTREKAVLGVIGAGVAALAVGALLHRKVPYKTHGSAYLNHRYKDFDLRTAMKDLHARSVHTPITATEKKAVVKYTTSAYAGINKKLRLGHKPTEDVANIDAALAKTALAENTVVYRGVNLDRTRRILKGSPPGTTFIDRGYPSTSLSQDVARTFAGSKAGAGTGHVSDAAKHGYVWSVNVDKGTPALPLTEGYTMHDMQGVHEVLLPRSSAFKVLRVDHDSKTIYMQHMGVQTAERGTKVVSQLGALDAPASDLADRFLVTDDDLEFHEAPADDTTAADYAGYVPPQPGGTKAFDPSQPRDQNGEWTDGGGSSRSEDWTVAKDAAFSVAKGIALTAAAGLVTALAPEAVLVTTVAAVATYQADAAFSDALIKSGTVILKNLGLDPAKAEAHVRSMLGLGLIKAAPVDVDKQLKKGLVAVAGHVRETLVERLRAGKLGAEKLKAAIVAIDASHGRLVGKLA